MTNATEITERIVRCRMAGIAMLLSTAVAAGANAQQETNGTTNSRPPCPPAAVSGSASTSMGASGVTTYGTTATTSTTGATTAAPTTSGTPTDAGSTAGVPAKTTPNNTSTNPDNRFKGLNATNGANGVGADTTTTGKRTATVAGSLPADSVNARAGATTCVPRTGSVTPDATTNQASGGDVQLDSTSGASRSSASTSSDSMTSGSSTPSTTTDSQATSTSGAMSGSTDATASPSRARSQRSIPVVKDRG